MKKTILVFGLLVAMVSCKKDNPQPVSTVPTPVVVDPKPYSYCEENKVGNLEIKNMSNYELIIYVDNVATCLVNPSSVKVASYIASGSHVVKAELSSDASIFVNYSVTIANCNTSSITVN